MGFIRGGLVVIFSVLLLISLLAGNTFLTLNNSLEYDVVQPEISSVVKQIAEENIDLSSLIQDEKFEIMKTYCENNSEYIFSAEGYTFTTSCETINLGPEAIIEENVNSLVEDAYYKEYECEFWDCLKETKYPFFLVSQKAKDYWYGKFYLFLMISIILIGLVFFLAEKKSNGTIVIGSMLIISALPFSKLDWLASLFTEGSIFQFFNVFFTQAYAVFLKVLILGIIVLAVGIGLKFFDIGFSINNFFEKFKNLKTKKEGEVTLTDERKDAIRDIVKEEVGKKVK